MGNLERKFEASLVAMIAQSSVAFVVCNPRLIDNPIIICNDAFIKLTGYSESEIVGRNCRFLVGKDTEPSLTKLIVDGIRDHRHVLVEILNYKRDGSPFRNAVMVAPLFDDDGHLAYFLGSQMEIADEASRTSSARRMVAMEKIKSLSPQQKSVLIQIAKGGKNKQIAHLLKISESTVKMHRSLAFSKMGVSTTAESIRMAVEAGL